MEMLIGAAIIAVLVAVAIPTFSSQLHKARVATDWANVRSYYAQLQYEFMETGKINNAYLNEFYFPTSPPGRTSFKLSGQEITLKEGSISGRENVVEGMTGYDILYLCNEKHDECQLVL